jgi:hypothetical protein
VTTVMRKGGRCPECVNGRLIPIVYGIPDPETVQLYEQGKVFLGGSIINEVFDEVRIQYISLDPQLGCPDCKRWFFRDGRRAP